MRSVLRITSFNTYDAWYILSSVNICVFFKICIAQIYNHFLFFLNISVNILRSGLKFIPRLFEDCFLADFIALNAGSSGLFLNFEKMQETD